MAEEKGGTERPPAVGRRPSVVPAGPVNSPLSGVLARSVKAVLKAESRPGLEPVWGAAAAHCNAAWLLQAHGHTNESGGGPGHATDAPEQTRTLAAVAQLRVAVGSTMNVSRWSLPAMHCAYMHVEAAAADLHELGSQQRRQHDTRLRHSTGCRLVCCRQRCKMDHHRDEYTRRFHS